MEEQTYICSKCKIEKYISEFPKASDRTSGHRSSCKECEHIRSSEYHKNNKEKINKRKSKNFKDKKEYYLESQRKRLAFKKKNSDLFKAKVSIRKLINISFRRSSFAKTGKTVDILGMDIQEFMKYISSKFDPWMNWNNYGKYNGEFNYGWDLDHIIPISSAKTEEDIIKLNHYTNFQPLCSKVNRDIKRNNLDYKTA